MTAPDPPTAAEPVLDARLSTPLCDLPFVAQRRAKAATRLGLHKVSDLLRHLPMRYEQHEAETTISELNFEAIGTARGTVVATRPEFAKRRGGQHRFVATLADESGRLNLTWFNGLYLRDKIAAGMKLRVQGKVRRYNNYPQMINPQWERLDEQEAAEAEAEQARCRPVYHAVDDLPSKMIESWVSQLLPAVKDQIRDPLPDALLAALHMPALAEALRMAHRPEHEEEAQHARRRLAYNELFLLQLGMAIKRHHARFAVAAPALHHSEAIDRHIRELFPFPLTEAQDQVIREIAADLQSHKPMNRMVQGDVGAGKTVVALYAMLLAVANRRQAALMAPTEILAEQHYAAISHILRDANVRVTLLLGQGSLKPAEREARMQRIAAGEVDLAIGTHALLSESVKFRDLAVAVIDEQHRFGVKQRARLREQATAGADPEVSAESEPDLLSQREPDQADAANEDENDPLRHAPLPAGTEPETGKPRVPHFLLMTATPIPRTLSLSVFGDLDVSVIHGLPPGRSPIITRVVGPEKSDDVYRYVVQRLARGEQAFVVVPAIDDNGNEDAATGLKNVETHTQLLQQKYCGDEYQVLSLHGRMSREERESVMQRFRDGAAQVLVATTVIEVGVDVPQATLMVVEHAERFGLAQLHQLRGRIGRQAGGPKSLCVFIADPQTEEASKRMEAIGGTADGFRIAELDLEIRGMGDFFGTRQSGLPPLRVADLTRDLDLLRQARRDAMHLVAEDPALEAEAHTLLRRMLEQQYGSSMGLIDVG